MLQTKRSTTGKKTMNTKILAEAIVFLTIGAFIGILTTFNLWWALLTLPAWWIISSYYHNKEVQTKIKSLMR
jgi:hypothetical protein